MTVYYNNRVSACPHLLSEPQLPPGHTKRAQEHPYAQWTVLQKTDTELRETESFLRGNSLSGRGLRGDTICIKLNSTPKYPLLQKEKLPVSSKTVHNTSIPRKTV